MAFSIMIETEAHKILFYSQAPVAHTYNPSNSGVSQFEGSLGK
jgi:hypothetical protein